MKRTLILLLVLLFTLLLGSCSQNSTSITTSPQSSSSTEPIDTSATNDPAAAESLSALPIAAEPVRYTIWTGNSISGLPITSYAENTAWQELENRTNVHIDWTHGTGFDSTEQFNLSIASGDWADSYWSGSWAGSLDYYIEEEMILDLTELISLYAPNYDSLRRIDQTTYRTSLTDASRTAGFYEISQHKQWTFLGPVIRQDFLDAVGMDVPQTYEQLHNVLVAFRDQLDLEIPLAIANTGTDDWFTAGFGTVYTNSYFNGLFYQIDGQVQFGPITDEFRTAVQTLASWYSEGLIDREFYARTDAASVDTDYMCTDQVGAGRCMYSVFDLYKSLSGNPDFELVPLYAPVQNQDDKIEFVFGGGSISYIKGTANVIMSTCENPETLVKWFDYLYSEDGALLMNYGIENEDYTLSDNGQPMLTEKIYADANLSTNQMLTMHTGSGSGGPWWYDWTREIHIPGINPQQLASEEIWTGNQAANLCSFSTLAVNQEDSSDYNRIMADVQTTISEQLARFITGEQNMDSDWDEFIALLYSQGIKDALEMQQRSYDNFVLRGE